MKGRSVFVLVIAFFLALAANTPNRAFALRAHEDEPSGPAQMTLSEEMGDQEDPESELEHIRIRADEEGAASGELDDADSVVDNVIKNSKSEGRVKRSLSDRLGHKHTRVGQYFKGLPIVGGELIIHKNGRGGAYQVNGKYLSRIGASIEPSISAEEALRVGLDEQQGKPGLRASRNPSLVIYGKRLAFEYVLSHAGDNPGKWRYYVDAHSGRIIQRYNSIQYAAPGPGSYCTVTGRRNLGENGRAVSMKGWEEETGKYYLYNLKNRWGVFDKAGRSWEENATANWLATDRSAVSCGYNLARVQAWVKAVLGRNSFDGLGGFAKGFVHVGNNYVNAYWDGTAFNFGDGDGTSYAPLTSLDIVAHEYGHALTQHTSDLNYINESGALNESYSDIVGVLVEFHVQPDGRSAHPSASPGRADWLLGEDACLRVAALRDMRNPKRYGQPSYYRGQNWYFGRQDNGGVHTNSGVQNFAFYLLSEGGQGVNEGHPYNIAGLGVKAAGEIALRANMFYLTPTARYIDSRNAWISAAGDLGYPKATVAAVWDAVGVLP